MRKIEDGRPSDRHSKEPGDDGETRVTPEDDFSPLGGYQPKHSPQGDFIIPSGKSKVLPADKNAGQSMAGMEGSRGDQDEGHGKKNK